MSRELPRPNEERTRNGIPQLLNPSKREAPPLMKHALAIAVVLFAATFAAGQSTTLTNGSGPCNTPKQPIPPPNQVLYCFGMSTSDGGWMGVWINHLPSTTFSDGQVYKYSSQGQLEFVYNDFTGTYVNSVISGTFNGGAGSTTQIIQIVRGACYKGTCHQVPHVLSGSTTY